MKIAIDLQACQTENSAERGIGRYSLALAKAIKCELSNDNQIEFILNGLYLKEDKNIKKKLGNNNITYYYYPISAELLKAERNVSRIIAEKLIADKYNSLDADIIFISNLFEGSMSKSVVPKTMNIKGKIVVATLYDLIPLIFSKTYLNDKNKKNFYFQYLNNLRGCDLLLAISESTRQDAIKYLNINPNKVINISGAVSNKFKRKKIYNKSEILKKYKIKHPFVMYTGGIDYRKNIEGLIVGYARVNIEYRKSLQLVIVCAINPIDKSKILDIAKKIGLKNQELIFTGFVSDDDLINLYNLCKMFVFPSMYEGFGLPVLEAMKCGAPVLGANNSSIAEIISKDTALFNEKNPDDIASKIERVISDKEFREGLIEWGYKRSTAFSWDKSAKRAIRAIKEATLSKLTFPKLIHTNNRKNIAYITPLPPQHTGIARYSAELLPALYKYFNIDIFTDCEQCSNYDLVNDFNIYSYKDFPAYAKDYDTIIYQIGNSKYHAYMYDMLIKYPGIIVEHDFFLGGMIDSVNNISVKYKNIFVNDLLYSHGISGLRYFHKHGFENTFWKYPLNKHIIDMATGIIFHSPYAYELYKKFYGNFSKSTICCIKQMHELINSISNEQRAIKRNKLGFSKDTIVIASFGYLVITKHILLIIKGFLQLKSMLAAYKVKLIFVGDCVDKVYKKRISEVINGDKDIFVTGYINDDLYQQYLYSTDIAIQLRTKSRGETSRAVLDCLAYGIPLIINEYATFKDYPDNVVQKIGAVPKVDDIVQALHNLILNPDICEHYSNLGKEYIKKQHNLSKIAKEYTEFINKIIVQEKNKNKEVFINRVGKHLINANLDKKDLIQIAECYRKNHFFYYRTRVLIFAEKNIWEKFVNNCGKEIEKNPIIDLSRVYLEDNDLKLIVTDGIHENDFPIQQQDNDFIITDIKHFSEELIRYTLQKHNNLYLILDGTSFKKNISTKMIKYINGIIYLRKEYVQKNIDNTYDVPIYDVDKFKELLLKYTINNNWGSIYND